MSLFIKVLTTGGKYSLLSPGISHLVGLLVHHHLSAVCFLLLLILVCLFLSAHIKRCWISIINYRSTLSLVLHGCRINKVSPIPCG